MRNKKTFLFDEETIAEEIALNGFSDGKINYSDMYLVAKYFRHKLGYGKIRLEKAIIKFCKEQDENFNEIVESESIKRWVDSAMKYSLRKIETLIISDSEVEFLSKIEVPRDRKLLFMTIVMARALKKRSTKVTTDDRKISDKYYIKYINLLDIVRLSELTNISENDMALFLHKYKEHFSMYYPEKELVRVNIIEHNPESYIEIDVDNPLATYDLLFGEMMTCDKCGNKFLKASNRHKYCPECSKEAERERKRKWWNDH